MDIFSLRKLQVNEADSKLDALKSIIVNPIETCNRKCSFCTKSVVEVDQTKKYKMDVDLVHKIANDLQSMNYSGRIGLNGTGEPMLHPELVEFARILKSKVPNMSWFELQTNGDFLTRETITELMHAGVDTISISMYDGDTSEQFKSMAEGLDIKLIFRHHYDPSVNYNLHLINRHDLYKKESQLLNIQRPCYLPFYKFFIDWTGDVLLCNNDVGKHTSMGNVYTESIKDIWFGEKFNSYRKELIKGNRKNCSPCNRCNIDGTLLGEHSVKMFEEMIKE